MRNASGGRYGKHALFIAVYAMACVMEYFAERLKKYAAKHLDGEDGEEPKDPD